MYTNIYNKYEMFFLGTCSPLGLSNGQVNYNTSAVNGGYPVDTRASFTCNSGYTRSGSSSRICQNLGGWNQQSPTCNKGSHFTLVKPITVVKIIFCSPIMFQINLWKCIILVISNQCTKIDQYTPIKCLLNKIKNKLFISIREQWW